MGSRYRQPEDEPSQTSTNAQRMDARIGWACAAFVAVGELAIAVENEITPSLEAILAAVKESLTPRGCGRVGPAQIGFQSCRFTPPLLCRQLTLGLAFQARPCAG